MFLVLLAQEAEEGIWSGNQDMADVCFLIGVILAAIGAVVAWTVSKAIWATCVAAALAFGLLGWAVL